MADEIHIWDAFAKNKKEIKEEVKNKNIKEYFKTKDYLVLKNDLLSYSKFIIINGIFLNYAANILLGMPLEYWTVPGYGIAWLYLKEEIPRIINSIYWRAN